MGRKCEELRDSRGQRAEENSLEGYLGATASAWLHHGPRFQCSEFYAAPIGQPDTSQTSGSQAGELWEGTGEGICRAGSVPLY